MAIAGGGLSPSVGRDGEQAGLRRTRPASSAGHRLDEHRRMSDQRLPQPIWPRHVPLMSAHSRLEPNLCIRKHRVLYIASWRAQPAALGFVAVVDFPAQSIQKRPPCRGSSVRALLFPVFGTRGQRARARGSEKAARAANKIHCSRQMAPRESISSKSSKTSQHTP